MINRAELKSQALGSLRGNWGTAILAWLIYLLITGILGGTGVGSLFAGLVYVGYAAVTVSLIRTGSAKLESMVTCITERFAEKFVSTLLVSIFTFLWTLLFIIPGIIKAFAYSMTPYILNDRPELSATDAIKESCRMMYGHKMDLFILYLSFIGWDILCVLTFGILSFYVSPYKANTVAAFYEKIKSEEVK